MRFIAVSQKVSPENKPSPSASFCIAVTNALFGHNPPLIYTLSNSLCKGYLVCRYSEVCVLKFFLKYVAHFSFIVKIPIRISEIGRVCVKGNKTPYFHQKECSSYVQI